MLLMLSLVKNLTNKIRLARSVAGIENLVTNSDPHHNERNKRITNDAPDFSNNEVYCNIDLGMNFTGKQCMDVLKNAGVEINPLVRMVLSQLSNTIIRTSKKTCLMRTTIQELGFLNGATLPRAFQVAKKGGANLCQWDVAPLFLLQYPNLLKENNAWFIIAMEPAPLLFENDLCVFVVERNFLGTLTLDVKTASRNVRWPNGTPIVFIHPNNDAENK